jgi:membrane protein YdbS with pleckstrin-like domain
MESFGLILVALVPFGFLAIPTQFIEEVMPALGDGQIGSVMTFVFAGWELIVLIVFMTVLTTYYLDIVMVTNKRIIDIDQIGLFARDVVSVPIEQVQDVKIETFGILAEIFKFGDLHLQTAAETKEVVVRGVRYPERTRDLIMEAYHTDKHDPQ